MDNDQASRLSGELLRRQILQHLGWVYSGEQTWVTSRKRLSLVHHSTILEFNVPSYRTEGAVKNRTLVPPEPSAPEIGGGL